MKTRKLGVAMSGALAVVMFASLLMGSYRANANNCDGFACRNRVSSPNGLSAAGSYLRGAAAVSSSQIWAVGYYINGTAQTLIEKYDGTSWSQVTSANRSGASSYLLAVNKPNSATSTDVWAVGYDTSGTSGANQTLIEKWSGSSWSIVTSTNPGGSSASNVLQGVSGDSPSDVYAVGSYYDGSKNVPLVEKYNGSSWSTVSTGLSFSNDTYLTSVSAPTSTRVWAAGYTHDSTGNHAIIIKWNGISWSNETIALLPTTSQLYGISMLDKENGWAVGSGSAGTLVVQFTTLDGWSGTNLSDPSGKTGTLYGVDNFKGNQAWAVGREAGSGNYAQTRYWDGSSWISYDPDPNTSSEILYGVSCLTNVDCWSVGYVTESSGNSVYDRTLIDHFTSN